MTSNCFTLNSVSAGWVVREPAREQRYNGQVMIGLSLALALVAQTLVSEGFRARLVVEEGGAEASYQVDFKPGAIRIEPPEAEVYLLLDIAAPTVTLVDPGGSCFCRMEPLGLRRLVEVGLVKLSWFPWVTPVSPDLIEGVSLEPRGRSSLPDGRRALHYVGVSPVYDQAVAEYWLDPRASPELFFQWRDVYSELWGDPTAEAEAAQQKRLDLYASLPKLPVISEERFVFLSRPRTLRLEKREPIPEDAFTIPDDYEEKTEADLYRESLTERLLRRFGIKGSGSAFCAGSPH
jgi:hypothetical protein